MHEHDKLFLNVVGALTQLQQHFKNTELERQVTGVCGGILVDLEYLNRQADAWDNKNK